MTLIFTLYYSKLYYNDDRKIIIMIMILIKNNVIKKLNYKLELPELGLCFFLHSFF